MELDILNTPDSEFNDWFTSFADNPNVTPAYRRAVAFFVEYYRKSTEKLYGLTYDELFEADMYLYSVNVVKEKENEAKKSFSKKQECQAAFDKLFFELKDYGLKEPFTREEIRELVGSYFRKSDRFIKLLPYDDKTDESAMEMLHNISTQIADSLFEHKNGIYMELDNVSAGYLCKYSRLLNLEAKMAHTSRMLYMTDICFKDITDPKLKELVQLSVMYHDIGRFYQSVYYPDFMDRRVQRMEAINELSSHAEIGYYFPIQTLISQDLIRCNGNMDEALLMHTLMSVVTKVHQKTNEVMPQYDNDYSTCRIDESTIRELIPFIKGAYEKGKVINFESKHKVIDHINDMENFNIDTVTSIIKAIVSISEYMKHVDIFDEQHKEMKDRIDRFLRKFFPEEKLESLYRDPSELTNPSYLEEMFGITIPEGFKVDIAIPNEDIKAIISQRFKAIEEKMLDKDFATEIDSMVTSRNPEMREELFTALKQMMGAAMTITTDMDKIDIFNQRINGSWEKTNGSVYKRETNEGELTREEVIDDFTREAFFSRVGEEPIIDENDHRLRGQKISGGATKNPNKVSALWFHLDQFITINMRNYRSFEYLRDNNILDQVRDTMVDLQDPDKKDILTSLIDEPIEFSKMFIDNILSSRIDENGNLVLNGEGRVPTVFTMEQIKQVRDTTVLEFKEKWEYVGDKPKEGNYPSSSKQTSK